MLDLTKLLLDEIEGGGVVVTPSRQRAAAVRVAYAAAKLRQGAKLWHTPDVVAYRPWLEREALRRADIEGARALHGAEEWLLWRDAVLDLMREAETLPTDSLVEALQRSARLMFDWRIPVDTLEKLGDAESLLLARALSAVDARCAGLKAVPSHRLIERLQAATSRRSTVFAGFMERTAARAAIMDHWTARGVKVQESRAEGPIGEGRVVCAQDATDEIETAAAWCREQLDRDPSRRLLVIVPDLDQRRYAVTQAFEHALTPQITMSGAETDPLFAIEGGQPLSAYPIVHHALTSLRFLCASLDFARWSEWFRSAFWRSPSILDRARLESSLRASLDIEVNAKRLDAVLQAAASHLSSVAEETRNVLTRATQLLEVDAEDARTWMWSRRFGAALRALGWPGSRSLTSAEQQTLARFQEVLAELAALGTNLSPMRAIDALKILEDLAGRTSFEPATGDPAVTLSASLSDPVIMYDGIWVTGLHGDAWPKPVSIDPFIPLAAQRQAGIPAVSPARMLEQARSLLNVWQRSAQQLVVSWPKHDGDREYLASPLLDELSRARSSPASIPASSGSVSVGGAPPKATERTRRSKPADDTQLSLSFAFDEPSAREPREDSAKSATHTKAASNAAAIGRVNTAVDSLTPAIGSANTAATSLAPTVPSASTATSALAPTVPGASTATSALTPATEVEHTAASWLVSTIGGASRGASEGATLGNASLSRGDVGAEHRLAKHTLGLAHTPSLAEHIRAARQIETYEDTVGEPWPVSKLVPAGVRTLEFQNRCPVLAYASFRLGATPLETPQPGVDYRDRGMLVHSALELLWNRLGGSQELRAAYGPQLDAMIDESVSQAMADAFAVGGIYQEQRSTLREHRRTARLIRNLCEVELQRPPFRISELEAERRWTSAAGTSMRLRIDRIDELDDGTFAIFDYKSGAALTQDWTSERVSHPQLLVYLLAFGADVSAIATAQLTPVRVGFKGVADRKGRLPRVPSLEGDETSAAQRWGEQKVRWHGTIERLAADFVAGAASIDPMENACRICHLHAFCRIADAPTDDEVGDP